MIQMRNRLVPDFFSEISTKYSLESMRYLFLSGDSKSFSDSSLVALIFSKLIVAEIVA